MSVPVNYQFSVGCVKFFDTRGRRSSRSAPWVLSRGCEDIAYNPEEVLRRILGVLPTPLPERAHTLIIGQLEAAVLYTLGILRREHFKPYDKVDEGPEYILVPDVYMPDIAQPLAVCIRRTVRHIALTDEFGGPL